MRASGWAPSALVYSLLTAILGRHVLAQLGTSIANDPGDPLLNAAVLHWNAHHIPWSDAWWQLPIYFPTRDVLAFSEHLLGLSVIASPIAWLTGNPLAAYNLTTLLTFPLCALAMYALVHRLTGSVAAAFLSGLAYGFAPYRISNMPHVQMLASFWAPLSLLGLHAFVTTRRRRWLVLFAAAWALQVAANFYTLILFSVLVGLWVLWFVVIPRDWRALGLIGCASLAAAVPLAPIVYKYVTVHALHGFERQAGEMVTYSADVAAVLCAPSNLTFWGWIRVACRGEGELFPGVALFVLAATSLVLTLRGRRHEAPGVTASAADRVVKGLRLLLLAVAGLYTLILISVLVFGPWAIEAGVVRVSVSDIDKPLLIGLAAAVTATLLMLGSDAFRRRQSIVSFYLFAALATWLLALGPTLTLLGEQSGRPGPFVLLQALPGVSGLRVPARFWLMTVICLTTIAGLVVAELLSRIGSRARAVAVVIVAGALVADGWAPPVAAQPPPPPVPDAAALPPQGLVLQVPIDPYPDIATTWRAVTGGWRSVNGYSGYAPNYYAALTAAARRADEAMFVPFRRDQDLHVVVADDLPAVKALVERQPEVVLTSQRDGSTQYRLPRLARSSDSPPGGARLPIVTAQSECASAQVPVIFDGDDRSRWECPQSPALHWLTVDLGTPAAIGAVVYSLGPSGWNAPTDLEIETSVDGAAWEPARRGRILRELIEGGLADATSLRATLSIPPRRARYVRLRPVDQPEEFVWFVAEVELRGP